MNHSKSSSDSLDQAFEKKLSRYVIGIDLGTTNCAVSFIDTSDAASPRMAGAIQTFSIEQMIDVGTRQNRETLPSFHYELQNSERAGIDGRFQFGASAHAGVVGTFARDRGLELPGRAIASAKSWLCNTMVDRQSPILPWGADDDVERLSPVEASKRYLEHIRRCWDREHPDAPMHEQDTIVTLPASFDELARRLTIQAAEQAGIKNLVLIEEPQAAFYAWLGRHEQDWMDRIAPGQSILVCDIGGGTTDFTLIRVVDRGLASETANSERDQSRAVAESLEKNYGLHRVAVGEHLMLGGDNLDLALARWVEERLLADSPGQEGLKPRQWDALKLQCRGAKETMLGSNPPKEYRLSIPGSGARLIESTKSIVLDQSEVKRLLVDGFFGSVDLRERPLATESGFQEFGLPYAADPNILRHLAAFLWDHRWAGRSDAPESMTDLLAARPDWVLFNGGVQESPMIKSAILEQLARWFGAEDGWTPGELSGNRLDLAVAQGAAYFGQVRRGAGVRIDARLAKTYYLQIESQPPRAMCIMPAQAQAGDRFLLDQHALKLTVGQPVQFPMLVSTTRLLDRPGDIIDIDPNQMVATSPIQTVLELSRKNLQQVLPVIIESELSEIGTLAIQLRVDHRGAEIGISGSEQDAAPTSMAWRLECDARGEATGVRNTLQKAVDVETVQRATSGAMKIFGAESAVPPKEAWDALTAEIGQNRRDWEPGVLREIWRVLLENSEYRNRSAEHETRWLNVLGWSLRPGFGVAADSWRVQATWRAVHNKLVHRNAGVQSEAIVLWRRIAGGFTGGQQMALYQDVWSKLKPTLAGGGGLPLGNNVAMELLRLLGSLELLPTQSKESLLETLVAALSKKRLEPLAPAILWTLGRLGTRVPLYGGWDQLVRTEKLESVLRKLLQASAVRSESLRGAYSLCLMQCAQRTGDRRRDLSNAMRQMVLEEMRTLAMPEKHLQRVAEVSSGDQDLEAIVGESLPLGFSLG
jgi:hypothetical protein